MAISDNRGCSCGSRSNPGWVPILDGLAGFRRNPQLGSGLSWFEWTPFYAARVLIASKVGSHLIWSICLIPLANLSFLGGRARFY